MSSWVVCAVASGAACSDDAATDPCGEPVYAGRATDEAWHVMLDGYDLATSGSDAATLTSPAASAVVSASGPVPTFAWDSPIAALPRVHTPFVVATAPRTPPSRSWLDAIGDFFVGRARAHLPPITSDLYYVEIGMPGSDCPLRVLTTNESWVPDEASWNTMRATPGAFTVTITSAYLVENRITEGPYRAAVVGFEIQ